MPRVSPIQFHLQNSTLCCCTYTITTIFLCNQLINRFGAILALYFMYYNFNVIPTKHMHEATYSGREGLVIRLLKFRIHPVQYVAILNRLEILRGMGGHKRKFSRLFLRLKKVGRKNSSSTGFEFEAYWDILLLRLLTVVLIYLL